MLILAIHQTPSLTRERYEEVVRRLTGKTRIEAPSDLPFDGLLVHAAGEGPNGFCVFDVFESEQAVEAFRNALGTIPEEVGIEEPPHFFAAHTAIATRIDRE
jgi:2'-5' RNA ligase